MSEEINDLWDRVIALDGRYSDLERRTEILEQRLIALEPPKFKKPFAMSLTPPPCDCDLHGVVHVMQSECPIWLRPEEVMES